MFLTVYTSQIYIQHFAFLSNAGAYLASGFLGPCAGINHSTPFVSFTALPPHIFMTPARNHFGFQITVPFGMPFFGKHRLQRFQIIESGQHLFRKYQVPIFAFNTKGAWTLRFDDILADALEAGRFERKNTLAG